jgi:hypothetical protein
MKLCPRAVYPPIKCSDEIDGVLSAIYGDVPPRCQLWWHCGGDIECVHFSYFWWRLITHELLWNLQRD